jgi:hypothetical protein
LVVEGKTSAEIAEGLFPRQAKHRRHLPQPGDGKLGVA